MAHLLQVIKRGVRNLGWVKAMAQQWLHTGRPWTCMVWLGVLVLFLTLPLQAAEEKPPETKPAKLRVSGYGLFGNRQLVRTLRNLEFGKTRPEFLRPAFIEDAALILTSRVRRDGFLQPTVSIRLQVANGEFVELEAENLLENPLDRPLLITRAEFIIDKGVLYYFKSLEFEGLETMKENRARTFFIETGAILKTKRTRIFTPERLKRGLASLTEVLEAQGYRDVVVEATDVRQNDVTGAVDVRVRVVQGPKYRVRSVREQFYYENATKPAQERLVHPDEPWSRGWLQDYQQSVKTNLFAYGYPDTTVEVETAGVDPVPGTNQVDLDLTATVKSGPRVRVGAVDFIGEKRTKETFLSRRVRVQRGDWLNPLLAEQGRYRLTRLGIFRSITLAYDPLDEHTRNITYEVEEGRRLDVSLLFGWGSYEMLRGGVETELFNIWGRGHTARLKAVQSFKSSSGDFTYTVPQFLAQDIDLFLDGSALRREEVSFTREEYGGGFGAHRFFRRIATDLTMRYQYEILNADDVDSDFAIEGRTNAAVSAIITDLKHDRRDNPLYPRKGHRVFTNIELASDALGGEVSYQRMDASASWHVPLGRGFYFSAGLHHGFVSTVGSQAEDLPFNRRFFPGGENSLRGYQEGEASPVNAEGKFVGAETYSLATVEFELALTPKWSLVLFSDSLGFARRLEDYPFDTGLYSVGAGIRWRTIVGPVRLEYGHNLNPRDFDPSGTLHFSLGYPF